MKLFIFGSTGDLVKRKIIPAFIGLKLEDLEIIALGRRNFTNEMYEDFICNDKCFKNFKNKPVYHKIEFSDEIICEKCDEFLDKSENNFFYVAMPPDFIEKILIYLGKIKEKGFKIKILIEKPFGKNLKDAENIKKRIIKGALIEDVFISDHYLFKEEVVGLKELNCKHTKIVSLENISLENRTYYNEVGALKDMVQSHFLNIVFRLLKNPRKEFSNFEVLEYMRGQYGDGKDQGYVKDLGKKSDTETFMKVKLKTKNKEFEFITGKKFDKKLGFIELDKRRIYLESLKDPYINLFLEFFSQNRKNFTTIDGAILAWKIIEKIELKKQELEYYPEGASSENTAESKV
jgi:glucose-6-phosphate 1-dehydrogenase